jgi:hypothetical protein
MSPYFKTCSTLLKKSAKEKIIFMNNLIISRQITRQINSSIFFNKNIFNIFSNLSFDLYSKYHKCKPPLYDSIVSVNDYKDISVNRDIIDFINWFIGNSNETDFREEE